MVGSILPPALVIAIISSTNSLSPGLCMLSIPKIVNVKHGSTGVN